LNEKKEATLGLASKNTQEQQQTERQKNTVEGLIENQDEPFDINKVSKEDIKIIESSGKNKGYVGSSESLAINTILREGEDYFELTPQRKKIVETMDRNMRPLGKEQTVYRYITKNDPLYTAKVGKVIKNNGYLSTTESIGHEFDNRPGRVEIKASKDAKVYRPKQRDENELILARGSSLRIVGREKDKDGYKIIAEYVNE